MTNIHFWDNVRPDMVSRWMKLPFWVVAILPKIASSTSELCVLLYLIQGLREGSTISIALTRPGLEFCGNLPAKAYYKAIAKFKHLGLKKIGWGTYDMSGFIKTLSKLEGAGPEKNNVPLDRETVDTDGDFLAVEEEAFNAQS